MLRPTNARAPLAVLALLALTLLAACGSGTEETSLPTALPFGDDTTGDQATGDQATGDQAADATPTSIDGLSTLTEPASAAALVSSLLATSEGRALMAQGLADQTGIDLDMATCFVDSVDADLMIALAGTGLDPASIDSSALPDGARQEISQVLDTCGIPIEILLG